MRAATKKQKRILFGIGIPVLVLILLFGACVIYLSDYYHAEPEAIAAFAVSRAVEEKTLDGGDPVFDPGDARNGFIFYPGGKVDHAAYAPLMRALSANGVLCVVCRMPFRLAVLDVHAADSVRAAFPDVERWYVGGHSLGGTIAAFEIAAHRGAYDGLVLLGSFATEDLSDEPIRVLSVYGSEDRVLDRERYAENRKNLPESTEEVVIEGGCHAYFGMYGRQKGDGEPTIANAEQIRITAAEIIRWMRESEGGHAGDS